MGLYVTRPACFCGLNSLGFSFVIYTLLIISYVEAERLHDDPCRVTAPAGTYRGLINASTMNPQSKYCKFLGIKYAEALGRHRFGKPIPVRSLGPNEVYDAFSYGNQCMQLAVPGVSVNMSEDCLFLNVYTPKIYTKLEEPLKAVIVYIYGGAFLNGGSEYYGPDYLVPQDVILVTMNYRVGPFGFLNLNITECPGNMGLWDQSLALKWVRRNIESFGGDRHRITVNGAGAGAISTYLHVLSPQSQGLFQRAIIQSPVTTYRFVKNDTVAKSIMFAHFFFCNEDSRLKSLRCLQRESLDELMTDWKIFNKYLETTETYRSEGPPFWPSEDVWQEQPFLPSTSLEILGLKAPNIDVIIGQVSADAGAYFAAYDNLDVVDEVRRNLHIYLRKEPQFARDERVLQAVADKVKTYYFNESNPGNKIDQTQKLLLDLTYDNWYVETIPFLSASYHNGKIRTYQFRVDDCQVMKKFMFKEDYRSVGGACHMEDADYLYFASFVFPNLTMTQNQLRVLQVMTTYWTNFAKTGNPNGDDNNDSLMQWKPILPFPSKPNYLSINNKSTSFVEGRMIEQERREFWAGLRRFAEQISTNDLIDKRGVICNSYDSIENIDIE